MKIVTVKMAKVMRATARMTRKEVVSADLTEINNAIDDINGEVITGQALDKLAVTDASKADIKAAIEAYTVDVDDAPLSAYAGRIEDIGAGVEATFKTALDAANEEASADLTAGIALVDSNYTAIKAAITAKNVDMAGAIPSNYAAKVAEISGSELDEPHAIGGTETTASGYDYHTFTSDGTLTVTSAGTFECLIVGGGGGGAGGIGGGGGAGGLAQESIWLEVGEYAVIVGAGGDGGGGIEGFYGTNGSPSQIAELIALGGGAGGAYATALQFLGRNGGSGGGTGAGQNVAAGASQLSQGNAGGTSNIISGVYGAGGGGGAGEAGANGTTTKAGNGGVGLEIWGAYYAGGGGAGGFTYTDDAPKGLGGNGGGGNGGSFGGNNDGLPGAANTGGGGGGGHFLNAWAALGGNGGSGIVIVRYPTP